jgi:hypothetical protein
MTLKLETDAISYGAEWRVLIADMRVIGEFLSVEGRRRHCEHFLVFMTPQEWFKAPYEAERREAFMAELGRRLGHELRCDLFNATNFSSRVLWPAHLEGRALYDLIPEVRSQNLVTRVRQMLMQQVDMRFSDEVRRELGQV